MNDFVDFGELTVSVAKFGDGRDDDGGGKPNVAALVPARSYAYVRMRNPDRCINRQLRMLTEIIDKERRFSVSHALRLGAALTLICRARRSLGDVPTPKTRW